MSIFIENELETDIPEDYKIIVEDIVEASIEYLECPYECEVNIIFTDNDGIREINNLHRGIDAPTDVLSFPMCQFGSTIDYDSLDASPLEYFNQDTGELMLGDIILNIDRINSQAEEYGHSFKRELSYMVVHSFYHLMGYDHMEEDEKKVMRQKEEFILDKLQILR